MKISKINKKYYKTIIAVASIAILVILNKQFLKSKRLTVSKGKDITIPFHVTTSAIKGFKLYLEPGNLKSIDNDSAVSFRVLKNNKKTGDTNNPNSLVWGIPKDGISIIDLRRQIYLDGKLKGWAISSAIDNNRAKFKVWREENDCWICVGESETVILKKGINTFSLKNSINVKGRDYLGFYTAKGSIGFQPWNSGIGKIYYRGDIKKGLKDSGIKDSEAGYSIEAYYLSEEIASFNLNASSLRKGYYYFSSSEFYKLNNAEVSINISVNHNNNEDEVLSLMPTYKNGFLSPLFNFYISPIYSQFNKSIEFHHTEIEYYSLFFNIICGFLLLSSFVLVFRQ